MPCCIGCMPHDARARMEVFAAAPIAVTGERVRLAGRLRALPDDDPSGWKFQLLDARALPRRSMPDGRYTRRNALLALACAAATQQACTSAPAAAFLAA